MNKPIQLVKFPGGDIGIPSFLGEGHALILFTGDGPTPECCMLSGYQNVSDFTGIPIYEASKAIERLNDLIQKGKAFEEMQDFMRFWLQKDK